MAISKLHEQILTAIDHAPLIQDEELARIFQMSKKDVHAHIREINLDQEYISENTLGYYVNTSIDKQWKKLRTTIVFADYEMSMHCVEKKLECLSKDIVISGSYYLYQPISSSKTEFMINTTSFHPSMQVPIVYVSPALNRHDIRKIRNAIRDIKREAL